VLNAIPAAQLMAIYTKPEVVFATSFDDPILIPMKNRIRAKKGLPPLPEK
jgi:hypothetical protein